MILFQNRKDYSVLVGYNFFKTDFAVLNTTFELLARTWELFLADEYW